MYIESLKTEGMRDRVHNILVSCFKNLFKIMFQVCH